MQSNRRNFLKNITLGTGAAVTTGFIAGCDDTNGNTKTTASSSALFPADYKYGKKPVFNMCGYAAPKIEKVRIGVFGIGNRGMGALKRLTHIDGAQVVAVCDKRDERFAEAQKIITEKGWPEAKQYNGEEGWKALMESDEIDLAYICTPWHLHTPMAVYAMNNGKHAASEVPIAVSVEECWELVETSEKTKKHCMMLENTCYDFFELLTLNMARQGMFGELIHAEGAYIHDLLDSNFSRTAYSDMWRLKQNATRNGSLYPTHGLGPVAQCLNINRGDKMDYLVSLSTGDFSMAAKAKELSPSDEFFKEYENVSFRGNMNTTVIKTNKGKSIMIQHDVSSPRPYSRIHLLSGTKGIAQKYPGPAKIAFGHDWLKQEELDALQEQFTPAIVKHVGEIAKKVGGHGGMDFMMDWRMIDCLRNGLPLDQDVYDAASWSVVFPLSETSVNDYSKPVEIPDFTRGNWKSNPLMSLTLDGGGNTEVRGVK